MFPPFFPVKETHKFSVCGIATCDCDAVAEKDCPTGEGVVYIPVCEKHKREKINKEDFKVTDYAVEHLFFRPAGFASTKCKYHLWRQFVERLEKEVFEGPQLEPKRKPAAPPRQALSFGTAESPEILTPPKKEELRAVDTWMWVSNFGRWMTITGETAKLSSFSDNELIGAALAIQQANFKRITARIAWVKKFEGMPVAVYPESEIDVGFKEAGEKLEEFEEELRERNVVVQ